MMFLKFSLALFSVLMASGAAVRVKVVQELRKLSRNNILPREHSHKFCAQREQWVCARTVQKPAPAQVPEFSNISSAMSFAWTVGTSPGLKF